MTIECRLSLLSTILAAVEIFEFTLMLKFLRLLLLDFSMVFVHSPGQLQTTRARYKILSLMI